MQAMWGLEDSPSHYLHELEHIAANVPDVQAAMMEALASLSQHAAQGGPPTPSAPQHLRVALPCQLGVCTELVIFPCMAKAASASCAQPALCIQHGLSCSNNSREWLSLLTSSAAASLPDGTDLSRSIVTVLSMDSGVLLQNDASIQYMGKHAAPLLSLATSSTASIASKTGCVSAKLSASRSALAACDSVKDTLLGSSGSFLTELLSGNKELLDTVSEQVLAQGAVWSDVVSVPAQLHPQQSGDPRQVAAAALARFSSHTDSHLFGSMDMATASLSLGSAGAAALPTPRCHAGMSTGVGSWMGGVCRAAAAAPAPEQASGAALPALGGLLPRSPSVPTGLNTCALAQSSGNSFSAGVQGQPQGSTPHSPSYLRGSVPMVPRGSPPLPVPGEGAWLEDAAAAAAESGSVLMTHPCMWSSVVASRASGSVRGMQRAPNRALLMLRAQVSRNHLPVWHSLYMPQQWG